jgi:hypothetical protein
MSLINEMLHRWHTQRQLKLVEKGMGRYLENERVSALEHRCRGGRFYSFPCGPGEEQSSQMASDGEDQPGTAVRILEFQNYSDLPRGTMRLWIEYEKSY